MERILGEREEEESLRELIRVLICGREGEREREREGEGERERERGEAVNKKEKKAWGRWREEEGRNLFFCEHNFF